MVSHECWQCAWCLCNLHAIMPLSTPFTPPLWPNWCCSEHSQRNMVVLLHVCSHRSIWSPLTAQCDATRNEVFTVGICGRLLSEFLGNSFRIYLELETVAEAVAGEILEIWLCCRDPRKGVIVLFGHHHTWSRFMRLYLDSFVFPRTLSLSIT